VGVGSAVEDDGTLLAEDLVVVEEVGVGQLGLAMGAHKVLWMVSLLWVAPNEVVSCR
jgi:hypothetical protein